MVTSKLHVVFVYGTLKTGQPNHWNINKTEGFQELLGKGTTFDKFPLLVGTRYNIPYLLNKKGEGLNVQGEIYRVDDQKLAHLDILEKHPVIYTRHQEKVILDETGEQLNAWIYVLPKWNPQFPLKATKPIVNYQHDGPRILLAGIKREDMTDKDVVNLFNDVLGYDPRNENNKELFASYSTTK